MMKRVISVRNLSVVLRYTALSFICLFAASDALYAVDDNLNIIFTTTDAGGSYGDRHVHVVWITDANDDFVYTVGTNVGIERAVWANARKYALATWWSTNPNGQEDIDARTGATQSVYRTYNIDWNFRRKNGTEVPDGTYRLYFECTNSDTGSPRNYTYFTITKGDSAWSQGPTSQGGYNDVTLTYTPGVVTAPVVENLPATELTSSSARLNGQVTDTGSENPAVIIYWGDNDGGTSTWDYSIDLGVKGAESFYADVNGLSPDTTYYFRCYATNSGGGSWAGSTASFTTAIANPAKINLVPEELTFPDTAVGDYADLSFDIINTGDVALQILSLQVVGLDKTVYTLVSPPAVPFDVPASNGTQTVTTRFTPTSAQTYNYAWVVVGSDDSNNPLAFVSLSGQSSASPAASLEVDGSVGGSCHAVALSGQYAFVGQGATLTILDTSNPLVLQYIGQARLVDTIQDIVLSGDMAYVAAGASGILPVRVAELSSPQVLEACETGGHAYETAVTGSTLWVANGASGLSIYDLSVPNTPVLSGTYATQGSATAVALSGTTAIVLDEQMGLQIIDVASIIPEESLRGHWKLDDDANSTDVLDSSGNGNDGTATKNTSDMHAAGKIGDALTFDGSTDYVDVNATTLVSGEDAFTISAWFKTNAGGFNMIYAEADSGTSDQILYVCTYNGDILFSYIGSSNYVWLQSSEYVNDDSWHQVVAVKRASNDYELYLDGNSVGTDTTDVSKPTLIDNVRIGNTYYWYSESYHFSGRIDDVRVYDRALGEDEVQAMFHGSFASGTCSEIEFGQAVAVSGSTAYVTDRLGGFFVVDVTDWAASSLLSEIHLQGGQGRSIDVSGTTVYVAVGHGGLEIIDVSDPCAPISYGVAATPGLASDVSVSGSLAYVADERAGLRVIDVSNPAWPFEQGAYMMQTTPYSVAVENSLAYASKTDAGIQVLDISSPASPNQAGSLGTLLEGDILVDNKVDFLDFSLLAQDWLESGLSLAGDVYKDNMVDYNDLSRLVGNWLADGTLDSVRSIVISGQVAYIAKGLGGLQILDVSDPCAPSLLGSFPTDGYACSVAVLYPLALVADGRNVYVLDISDNRSPELMDVWVSQGRAFGLAIDGSYGYVADGGRGLLIIDLSDPSNVAEAGSYQTPGVAYGVAVGSGVAYVADGPSGLQILDVSTPSVPSLVSTFDTPGTALNVVVAESKAYVADGLNGLSVIDVSTPSTPTLYARSSVPVRSWSVTVSGSQIIVADDAGGLVVLGDN